MFFQRFPFFLKLIKIALILSHPTPLIVSLAMSSSNKSSIISFTSSYFSILLSTISTILSVGTISQTPSHPIIAHLSFPWLLKLQISGSTTRICSSLDFLGLLLYSKSPNARDKFKFALILPSETNPPARRILSFSLGKSGLWSFDRAVIVLPELTTILRASPVFAQIIIFG